MVHGASTFTVKECVANRNGNLLQNLGPADGLVEAPFEAGLGSRTASPFISAGEAGDPHVSWLLAVALAIMILFNAAVNQRDRGAH